MPRLQDTSREQEDITPNDSVDLPTLALAIYVGVGGTLRYNDIAGNLHNTTVVTGTFPYGAKRVHATGTTATQMLAAIE